MARVKMVKCYLRSPGSTPSLRFVPLREFNLWKYFMTHRHGKIVEGEEISVWIDAATYSTAPPRQPRPLEPVVRVDLEYWDAQQQVVTPVQRYFPAEEYDSIREKFVGHYPDLDNAEGRPLTQKRLHEVKGYFIRRHIPAAQ